MRCPPSLRSSINPRIANELRFGLNRGLSLFRPQVSSPAQFSEWSGYAPIMGFSLRCGLGHRVDPLSSRRSGNCTTICPGRRDRTRSPSAGMSSQINLWYETIGTSVIPSISFGAATNDPVVTGSTNLFTDHFDAWFHVDIPERRCGALRAADRPRLLISRSVAYNGQTYGSIPQVDRSRQYEYGFFAQDSWKVAPSLTVTMGLRFEVPTALSGDPDQAYSSVSYASVWGISGVGNLFNPNADGRRRARLTTNTTRITTGLRTFLLPRLASPGSFPAWTVRWECCSDRRAAKQCCGPVIRIATCETPDSS